MQLEEKRKKGGGKLSRSETVTVRLDPKLRYMAELASRKQRRTLSSFIEWAIEEILETLPMEVPLGDRGAVALADEASYLWDVDDADRLAKLALRYPDLLTHEEQVLWKLIRENGFLWRGHFDDVGEWTWSLDETSLLFENLRSHWPAFCSVAEGAAGPQVLPIWQKVRSPDRASADLEQRATPRQKKR